MLYMFLSPDIRMESIIKKRSANEKYLGDLAEDAHDWLFAL